MGNRTYNATRFLVGNVLKGTKKASQFAINTGRSIGSAARDATDDIEPFEWFKPTKPQATRRKKK